MTVVHPVDGLFQDRYRLQSLLKAVPGRETWLASDTKVDTQVVVKLTSVSRLPAAGRWLLQREAAVLRVLEHPCLVPVVDAGLDGAAFYVVLPFRPLPTLRQRLTDGPLSPAEALRIAIDVLHALEVAHAQGVLHRNLNAANVLYGERSQVMDFSPLGTAELADDGVLPTWLAPEQTGLLHAHVDSRADLYAVGCLLYECVTGRPPFVGETLTDLLQTQLRGVVTAMRETVPATPRSLDDVVTRLLARDPRARYQSAAGVLWDVEALKRALDAGEEDADVALGLFDRRFTLAEPAFVGRRTELARLAARLDGGRGGVVCLEGASGLGKSRLLQEAALLALARGRRVLKVAARPQSAEHPFEVLSGVVLDWRQQVGVPGVSEQLSQLDGERRGVLHSLLPVLRDVLPDAPPPPAVSESYVLDMLAALLQQLGSDTVVLLDDVQWADVLTRRTLQRYHAMGGATLVLAAARTDDGAGGLVRVERLPLLPFSSEEARHLAESMAGPLPAPVLDVLGRMAEGNPFMLAESLRALVSSGSLRFESGAWRFREDVDLQATPRAAAALTRRLGRLPPSTRQVLAVAAVLGRECDVELLAEATAESPDRLLDAIEEARQAHLVWRTRDASRIVFAHDRLRDTLLSEIDSDRRATLHRQAAQWLQARHPDQCFELAYHLQQALAPEAALPWVLRAAEEARRRHALDAAARFYAQAAPYLHVCDPGTRDAGVLAYAEVLIGLGRFQEAEAWVSASRCGGPQAAARLDALRARLALSLGDAARASTLAAVAAGVLQDAPTRALLAEAVLARGHVEAALEVCRTGGGELDAWRAHALAVAGRVSEALAVARTARRQPGPPLVRARRLLTLVPVFLAAARPGVAERCLRRARPVLLRHGDARDALLSGARLAEVLWAAGRVREAAAEASRVVAQAGGDVPLEAAALLTWALAGGRPATRPAPTHVEARAALGLAAAVTALYQGDCKTALARLDAPPDVPLWRGRWLLWTATARRRAAEAEPPLAGRARRHHLEAAEQAAREALALSRTIPALRAGARREAALAAAMRGRERRAVDLLEAARCAARPWPYEAALVEHAADPAEGLRRLLKLGVQSVPELGLELSHDAVISVRDRFGNVIDSARRLVGAASAPAVLETLQDAARTLLRTEHLHVWTEPEARWLEGDPPLLADALRDRQSGWLEADGASGVAAPVRVGGAVRYVLVAIHPTPGVLGPDEAQLVDYLCTVAGGVLDSMENVAARIESETRFRILYERADVGIVLVDTGGRVLEGNPFLCRTMGYAPEELPGLPFDTLLGPLYREQAGRELAPLFAATVDHCRLEVACRRKTGELLWMELAASLVRAADGRPRFVIGALSDIGHRRLEQVVSFQEAERQVLSSELHDTIAQPLVAVYYGLQALEPVVEGRALDSVQRLADQAEGLLSDLRLLIANLTTPEAEDFDAFESVARYIGEFRIDSGLQVRFFSRGDDTVAGVTGLFLYRIVQEALRNVARHAQAERVVVRLDVGPGRVRGTVVDDGRGVPDQPVRGRHFGVRGMRERARLLGGWCHVGTRPAGGTRVVFELPLRPGGEH